MYTEGAQTTGQQRYLQNIPSSTCPYQNCVHYEKPAYGDHGGLGSQAASARPADHPSLDCRRDIQAPCVKDVGGRAFAVDRVKGRGHHSPQRRPMFAGPGLYSQSNDLSHICPWELNPAQWSYPPEPGVRHCPSVREQCGCVALSNTRAHPFNTGIPHPLPHLQVKGQGYMLKRTVRCVSVAEDKERCGCTSESYQLELYKPLEGHSHIPNGHCGQRSVFVEIGEETDSHQDRGRARGGSEEGCNGGGRPHKGFFPTEVPHKYFNQSRQKGPCVPPSGITSAVPSKSTTNGEHQRNGLEVVKQKRRHNLVRDQIRQVVTELEDVLGGLKQVQVEMKEVVEQIDRLTAGIDLSEELPCIADGGTSNFYGSGDLKLAPLPNHKPAPVQVSQHTDEDCIILRTNSPSPVHMASVVKTSCFTPTNHNKEINQRKLAVNGHPPHVNPSRNPNHTGHPHSESHSLILEPMVIIGNTTSNSRTQRPPHYRQNGRCLKGSLPPSQPVRGPTGSARGRQNTSVV